MAVTLRELRTFWRQVKSYAGDGGRCPAAPGGMTMPVDPELLDGDFIHAHSSGPGRVEVHGAVTSTQDVARGCLPNLADGDAIFAELQSKGRGQRGNAWEGGAFCGLCVSVVWHFARARDTEGLPVALGAALARELGALGAREVSLKWPNDLYLRDRKLCGILVESAVTRQGACAIVGVGINITPGVGTQYAYLQQEISMGRNEAAAMLLGCLRGALAAFRSDGLSPYRETIDRCDRLYGQMVTVRQGRGQLRGIARGIDAHGALILDIHGRATPVSFGHVTSAASPR
ncbi:MAG: biotin--[acetyl-CoA-carboxylase] ligase [Succinivibrionaceae bacterium]|nr:biotin--[acetyl-CoA-carboxylase] ligase [Succinivibrionaceae bacterium]